MPIKKRRPMSPGQRFRAVSDYEEVTKKSPETSLVFLVRSLQLSTIQTVIAVSR